MIAANSILNRIAAMRPHVKPMTREELAAIHAKEAAAWEEQMAFERKENAFKKKMIDSGLKERHQRCTFENYVITSTAQQQACDQAKQFARDCLSGNTSGFVFQGTSGTGKNHLAASIAQVLMRRNYHVLIITVADLMMKIRDTYRTSSTISENELIKQLTKLDLLVLDEVGIQRGSQSEQIILNQIINARSETLKATGIITNLSTDELVQAVGERAWDRIRETNCQWVGFEWQSHRRSA